MNAPPTPPKPYPWLTAAVRASGKRVHDYYEGHAKLAADAHTKAAYNIAAKAVRDFATELIAALEAQTPTPDARPKCTCRFINQGLPDAVHAVDPQCPVHRKRANPCTCSSVPVYSGPDGFQEFALQKDPRCRIHGCKCEPRQPNTPAGPLHRPSSKAIGEPVTPACPMWSAL